MDINKKKKLDEKLRFMLDQSQKEQLSGKQNKQNRPYPTLVIRRRKGVPDQSIQSIL